MKQIANNVSKNKSVFGKVIGIVSLILLLSLIAAQGINVYLANETLDELVESVHSLEPDRINSLSITRDALMYEEYADYLAGGERMEKRISEYHLNQELYRYAEIEHGFVFPLFFKSEAEITVTTVDMKSVLIDSLDKLPENPTEHDLLEILGEELKNVPRDNVITLTVPMELTKHGWAIETEHSGLRDALSGGFYSAATDIYLQVYQEQFSALNENTTE